MRVLACPASLKGVLGPIEAAAALAEGLRRVDGIEVEELPLEDGGEGTLEVIFRSLGGEWRAARVSDPLGRPVEARYLELADGRAVVESAQAIEASVGVGFGLLFLAREGLSYTMLKVMPDATQAEVSTEAERLEEGEPGARAGVPG